MKPFRVQMDFVVAAKDLDRAVTLHDRISELAEGMGLHYEGGGVFKMPDEDVVEGSPLDQELGKAA